MWMHITHFSMTAQWTGRFQLIYLDPPFGTGKAFGARVEGTRTQSSQMVDAYRDDQEFDAYLAWLARRLALCRDLRARSALPVLMLAAMEGYSFIPGSFGGKPADLGSKEEAAKLRTITDKAQIIEHLNKGFAYAKAQLEAIDPRRSVPIDLASASMTFSALPVAS